MLATTLENRMRARFKLRHLQILVQVAKHGNITKAAEQMHLAQPALTKSIKDLEAHLGMDMFVRSQKGVTLTSRGEVLIHHARRILAQIKHASQELASLTDGIIGHLTIGTLLAASPLLLPNSLLRIRSERPGIGITIIEGTHDQLIPSLITGDLDMILGRLPETLEDGGVVSKVLYREPICVVARNKHPLAQIDDLSLNDLLGYPWILPLPDTTLREDIDSSFRNAGLESPKNSIESISTFTNRKLLTDSNMIAVMPYQILRFYEQTGLLSRLQIQLNTQLGAIGMTLQKDAEMTPTLKYAQDVVLQTAAKIRQDIESK